ncbi:PilZ domain-containing protein [Desulfomonile tiedjei]|uniref:PilZ domain-containing protein n=1 Tax=Desulfomonile tiedjei (strain ATCC 49306 / DSM 6799 / DCB-1) TaxID=706587 RepID=I4C7G3_DESTA|nr:PilZ domain-containing protein [Desulfomonile tiedjei]AFM25504.1 PilZ domain-containing protein [Desulfomonile tiedjei DSM 6799]
MDLKREIEAKDLIFDIRTGMTDAQLMEKYRLTYKGLRSALKKLLNVQAISPEELYERFPLYEVITAEDMKELVKGPLAMPLPVYESNDPDGKGQVRNISEQGVGIRGLASKVGETKHLVLDPTELASIDLISFYAQCRWVKKKSSGEYVAGFEIIRISREGFQDLKKIIRLLESK